MKVFLGIQGEVENSGNFGSQKQEGEKMGGAEEELCHSVRVAAGLSLTRSFLVKGCSACGELSNSD